jgi:pterin-4a-carbinolamine dehydratase
LRNSNGAIFTEDHEADNNETTVDLSTSFVDPDQKILAGYESVRFKVSDRDLGPVTQLDVNLNKIIKKGVIS